MRSETQKFVVAIMALVFAANAVVRAKPATTGAISKVTVYRGQALVTRTLDVDLVPGTSELVVRNLPAKIVPESLYAQTLGDVKVLSVRYRETAVKEDTREEVKQLDAKIEDVKNRLNHAEKDLKHANDTWSKFSNLWKMSVDAANVDLNRSVMQSDQIESFTQYLETKSTQWHQTIIDLQDLQAGLQQELELLGRKRQELAAGHSRTEREAALFFSSDGKKKATLELSYLVEGANWIPQYNLRAVPEESQVLVEYHAVVNQTSGEDWNGVAVSLSTAQPTMVAAPPILEPMLVDLSRPVPTQEPQSQPARAQAERFRQQQRARNVNIKKGIEASQELNMLALDNQAFLLQASESQVEQFKQQVAEIMRTEGISVTYQLPGKLTLPSRSDQQLVTIAAITTKAEFSLLATPLLTDYVYLQADLLNDSDTVLLPGQAAMFRNGEFVGKGQLPQVTIGETFTAGFGIDSQVQVAHELEDKKTRIQGGNRIDTYHYRIALSNYRNTTANVRLLDRLPYTDNSSIKIELGETEPALSKDTEYLRTARKKNILRWDLQLAPRSFDENATVVKYTFTMEYDRNMQIQPRETTN
jgi:uncharacterized protein (TIGR02231 family)